MFHQHSKRALEMNELPKLSGAETPLTEAAEKVRSNELDIKWHATLYTLNSKPRSVSSRLDFSHLKSAF